VPERFAEERGHMQHFFSFVRSLLPRVYRGQPSFICVDVLCCRSLSSFITRQKRESYREVDGVASRLIDGKGTGERKRQGSLVWKEVGGQEEEKERSKKTDRHTHTCAC